MRKRKGTARTGTERFRGNPSRHKTWRGAHDTGNGGISAQAQHLQWCFFRREQWKNRRPWRLTEKAQAAIRRRALIKLATAVKIERMWCSWCVKVIPANKVYLHLGIHKKGKAAEEERRIRAAYIEAKRLDANVVVVKIARCNLCECIDCGTYRKHPFDGLPLWPDGFVPHHNQWCKCGTIPSILLSEARWREVVADLESSLTQQPPIAAWCVARRTERIASLQQLLWMSEGPKPRYANTLWHPSVWANYPEHREVKALLIRIGRQG
jgi:hypothetical protein